MWPHVIAMLNAYDFHVFFRKGKPALDHWPQKIELDKGICLLVCNEISLQINYILVETVS